MYNIRVKTERPNVFIIKLSIHAKPYPKFQENSDFNHFNLELIN